MGKYFFKKSFYSNFATFTDSKRMQVFNCLRIRGNFLFHFTCLVGHFEEKAFFEKFIILWSFSGFERENLGQVVKTAFYMSRGTFLGKIIFIEKSFFFIIFGLWVKKFLTFGENYLVGLSKLDSTCPYENFRVFKKFSQTWTNLVQHRF